MDDIQSLFMKTIVEFMEDGLKIEFDEELGYNKYVYKNKDIDNSFFLCLQIFNLRILSMVCYNGSIQEIDEYPSTQKSNHQGDSRSLVVFCAYLPLF